ncbi:MAG: hypothetical protein IK055_06570 [Lachnospiraceae bacterium]|nr:hypothetical protein [Lachnospiraceae bacterium]
MFKSMDQNEMMTVNGGFYYVPKYKNGKCTGTVQVSNSFGQQGYKCYIYISGAYRPSTTYPWE